MTSTTSPVRVAAIDVGTNTTLLLLAEGPDQPHALLERAHVTRLGRGIGSSGQLHPENIQRTLAVLRDFATLAGQHAAPIVAVGTEALRRAPNADQFLQPARAILGVPVEVIGGEREANLTFLAASRSFPALTAGRLLVIDIGGGSTEFVLSAEGRMLGRASLPLGSVRLTETHFRSDPPRPEEIAHARQDVADRLATLPTAGIAIEAESPAALVGTAGTVTTLAAMVQGLASYDPDRVHGFILSQAALQTQVARLVHSTESERMGMVGLDPGRADVILAGALLLEAISIWSGTTQITVSDRGVRWGLALEYMESRMAWGATAAPG